MHSLSDQDCLRLWQVAEKQASRIGDDCLSARYDSLNARYVADASIRLGGSCPKSVANVGISCLASAMRGSTGTLRDWEQRRKLPDAPARAYLTVIARNPQAVARTPQTSRIKYSGKPDKENDVKPPKPGNSPQLTDSIDLKKIPKAGVVKLSNLIN